MNFTTTPAAPGGTTPLSSEAGRTHAAWSAGDYALAGTARQAARMLAAELLDLRGTVRAVRTAAGWNNDDWIFY